MRVACPACSTNYDIPEERLTAGTAVRCARCKESWVPRPRTPPPEPPPAEPESGAPRLPTPREPPEPMAVSSAVPEPPSTKGGRLLLVAWLVSIVAVTGGIAALFVFRSALMHTWPPSIRLFALLGMSP